MSDFIDGKELKAYWGKRGFELFNCLKKGLQPYTPLGHKIADTDTLEHTRERSFEQVLPESVQPIDPTWLNTLLDLEFIIVTFRQRKRK